ncbi:aspartate aminotransferase family protein [bacterium]|nr:MAG: aspartate aminotransferase family protein [bacterium]
MAAEDASFAFNAAGLDRALALLKARRGAAGAAHTLDVPERMPEAGLGESAALEALAVSVLDGAAPLGAPGTFAHMDPPTPWITWALALWNAALNQNLLHPETAPVAREVERRAVDWLAPFFGMRGGQMVAGSTLANLTALWAAREVSGVREVVASAAAHLSVRKAAALLGLRFREVPVDGRQRLQVEALGDVRRSALVLTAGTTASGAIDPLDVRAGAAWVHVDAAWAGPLRLSTRHAGLLDGIEQADSVAVSAHKWFFQPKESALVLFARWEEARAALSFGGGYLAVPNVGVAGSRGAAAVPLLATLLAWGRRGLAERVERCMALAEELAALVRAHPELELFAEPVCGVLAWRPRGGGDLRGLRARMRGAFVSLAQIDGSIWLRSVAANPLAQPQRVLEAVLAAR